MNEGFANPVDGPQACVGAKQLTPMTDARKVFISYRRTNGKWFAQLLFYNMRANGYDAFMDAESIDSGDFHPVLLHQIKARPHFLLVLTPGAVARLADEDDWLRREIEYAIDQKRNIVPLLVDGFRFDGPEYQGVEPKLSAKLKGLSRFNGLEVPQHYFEEAMEKLRRRFLKEQTRVPAHVTSSPKLQPMEGTVTPLEEHVLTWSVIEGANYVLEISFTPSFEFRSVAYEGPEREFAVAWRTPWPSNNLLRVTPFDYYRVKAVHVLGHSTWSNVVKVKHSQQSDD